MTYPRSIAAALVVISTGCTGLIGVDDDDNVSLVGSGVAAMEVRVTPPFDQISVNGVAELFVDHTGTESVEISGDDNIVAAVRTEIRDGRLILGLPENTNTQSTMPLVFRVSVRTLRDIVVAGVMRAEVDGVDAPFFSASVSGVSGLRVAGVVDRQRIIVSGVSEYHAGALDSREARFDGSGVLTAVIRVSDLLQVKGCGVGSVVYIGDPRVTSTTCSSLGVRKQ